MLYKLIIYISKPIYFDTIKIPKYYGAKTKKTAEFFQDNTKMLSVLKYK